jgi:nucleoside-diphosphate-sugar epimerase
MRVLITGNMGYIGPMVVRHLRNTIKDLELIGYDAGFFGHSLTMNSGLPETMLDRQVYGDTRDLPAELLEDVDAVVHLAALSNDPIGTKFAEPTRDVNYRASTRLAAMARDAGVKSFVFASSCSVYGESGDAPRRETDGTNPLTAYAHSKIDTEDALRQMDLGGMTVSCLRFATACGMSDRLRLDLVLNDFVACAIADRKITILSDGTPWRPLIDVTDMARAIEWAIGRKREQGGPTLVVNVGSDQWNYRVSELAQAVASKVPGVSMSVNANAPPDRRSYRVDFSLFRSLAPAHQPVMTLENSITRVHDGLTSIGFTDSAFRSGPFVRLREFERLMAAGFITADVRWNHSFRASAR